MEKRNKTISICFLVAATLAAFLGGCSQVNQVSRMNISSQYDPASRYTDLESVVYHVNDSLSTVFVDVALHDMKYVLDELTGEFTASYMIRFRLRPGFDRARLIDSASFVFGDSLFHGITMKVVHSFDIKAVMGSDYLLELELRDLQRQESVYGLVNVEKSVPDNRQSFLVIGSDGRPLFRNYTGAEEKFRILSSNKLAERIVVRYYDREFPPAKPPFVQEKQQVYDYRADSLYFIPLEEGETGWIMLWKKGFYHFQTDTLRKEGLTVFRFHDGYPEITRAEQMVFPLKYITTREEYEALDSAEDAKMAADEFWLRTAGNPGRARALIQKFYKNVEEANLFFTSYEEGWKTDRGIVYVVYGRPTYVYRDSSQEEWIYGEPDHRNSLRFNFAKISNPFSDNDYLLLRSPTFKDPWYFTVQSWRR